MGAGGPPAGGAHAVVAGGRTACLGAVARARRPTLPMPRRFPRWTLKTAGEVAQEERLP
jgi:hypothetical protein